MNATTFYNVTITIQTDDPKDAYNKLCDALATELFPDHNSGDV